MLLALDGSSMRKAFEACEQQFPTPNSQLPRSLMSRGMIALGVGGWNESQIPAPKGLVVANRITLGVGSWKLGIVVYFVEVPPLIVIFSTVHVEQSPL